MGATKKRQTNELKFEIDFYKKLIAANPDFIDALIPLAENYTRIGDYESGLKMDLRLAALKPKDDIVHYNLACSYSLVGEVEKALSSLKKAINLGYNDVQFMHKDPDLERIREDSRYKKLIFKISKHKPRKKKTDGMGKPL